MSVTEVKNETNMLYAQAIGRLKAKGIEIQSIVLRRKARNGADVSRYSPYSFATSIRCKPSDAT